MKEETLNIKIRRLAKSVLQKLLAGWRVFASKMFSRASAANLLMIAFILLTSVGAFLIYPPAGFVVSGIACGLFGLILGLE